MSGKFEIVGIRQVPQEVVLQKEKWWKDKPVLAAFVLFVILAGCLTCDLFMAKDPAYLDLRNCNVAPNREFWFGTDTMGRDIFSMVWYGGRISLSIGFIATLVSTAVAVVLGTVSGTAPAWVDALLMRGTEILLSVPSLLIVLLVQAMLGGANIFGISFAIGITSWMGIAKIVRTQVRQLCSSEYVIASKCMGGGFFHILWKHLAPNFVSSIMFMVVMNIRNAIVAESTLSFMGIGLPVETVSWGSMLSMADKALLTESWWIIVIPGIFLAVTLLCVTSLGNYLRGSKK